MEKTMKLSQRGPVVATASIVSVKQEDNALVKPATSAAASDLSLVKEISEKLKLATRRPSVVQWKQFLHQNASNQGRKSSSAHRHHHLRTQSVSAVERESLDRRYCKVQEQLDTLRHDLILMRLQDNKLARVLLDTRRQLNRARAHKSCDEHAEMLDDVAWELEEEEELTGLYKACDLLDRKPAFLMSAFSPLLHIGVSKMNLNERRFSIR